MTKQEIYENLLDEDYLSKWIEAEYEVMAWPKVEPIK